LRECAPRALTVMPFESRDSSRCANWKPPAAAGS
jgi:hypothetical protein